MTERVEDDPGTPSLSQLQCVRLHSSLVPLASGVPQRGQQAANFEDITRCVSSQSLYLQPLWHPPTTWSNYIHKKKALPHFLVVDSGKHTWAHSSSSAALVKSEH